MFYNAIRENKILAKISGFTVEALEVEAGVKPLCIKREELAVRQEASIMMKTDNTPIKMSWDSFIENDQTERKMSPFGKMNIQVHVADVSTNTDISLHSLEKEFNFLESLQPTKISTEYRQTLGSSKTRTAEQQKLSR